MSTIVTRSGKGVPLTATDHDNNVNNLNTDKVETLADLSITSTATEINLLDGVTATTAELNYVDGVTSNIQTQLGTKLPLAGGTMTGTIAGFTSTGIDDNATSTAMTIDNSGNVLVGTTTVGGTGVTITSPESGGTFSTTSNTVARNHIRFKNPNGTVGAITTSGTATTYATSSDYRLKENVIPMSGSIDRLKELKPSRFNFIADADKTVDGFLAHEAQAIVPEAVTGAKDAMKDEEYEVTPAVMDGETVVTEAVMGTRSVPDMQGIDQSKLSPLTISALQEAITLIEQLTARVTELENA